jgi:hypothetical protein
VTPAEVAAMARDGALMSYLDASDVWAKASVTDPVESVLLEVREMSRSVQACAAEMARSNELLLELLERHLSDTRAANIKAEYWARRYHEAVSEST